MSCHRPDRSEAAAAVLETPEPQARSRPVVALAGNPNVGKSTLFNALTGGNQQVGNWPGKTVTRKSGLFRSPADGWSCDIVDLPGTYSLDPVSPEEEVARDALVGGNLDAVIAVADSTHLERTLYLVLQLRELQHTPAHRPFALVVALTMLDLAKQQGVHLDVQELARRLQLPVVPVDWTAGSLSRLMQVVRDQLKLMARMAPRPLTRSEAGRATTGDGDEAKPGNAGREEDPLVVAGRRYAEIERILAAVVRRRDGRTFTDRLDEYLLHPWFGYLFLGMVLAGFFWLTFAGSSPLVDLLDRAIGRFGTVAGELLTELGAPAAAIEFVRDGVIGGVGAVLAFFPLMAIFFFLFAFLQDSGYLARAAFLLDRWMQRLGFHGRVFFVLLSGYGCNVPGVLAARILDNADDRRAAILLEPLIPCAARLGVMAFMVAAFFPPATATAVLLGLLVLDGVLVAVAAYFLRRRVLSGRQTPFLLELPDYHWPSLRTLLLGTWHEVRHFLQKAGGIILVATAGFWLASHLPWGVPIDETLAGWLGRGLALFLGWLGLDWRMSAGLLSGAIAKETALSTLAVALASQAGPGAAGLGDAGLPALLAAAYTPAQALSFLTIFMLYFPCLATARVMQQELGDRRWFAGGVAGSLALSLVVAGAVHAVASRLW